MKTQIQLILSTLALSALIWTYADQTSHETYTALAVPIRLSPPEPLVLQIRQGSETLGNELTVDLTVRATKSRIRAFKTDQNRFALNLPITQNLVPGQINTLDLTEQLLNHPEIKERGLELRSASPASVEFKVLRFRRVPVDLQYNTGSHEAEVTGPRKVHATVLETSLGTEGVLPPLQVDLAGKIDREITKPGPQGDELTLDVQLESSWTGIEATFDPPRLTVRVKLQRRLVKEQISYISLQLKIDPQAMGQFVVELEDDGDLVQSVDVRGPEDKVANLKGRQIDAYVTIDETHLPTDASAERRIEEKIRFVLPPDHQDVEITSPPRMVKLSVRRKANAEANGLTPTP